MITNMECWALRAQINEVLALAARGKKPTAQLVLSLRASEAALQIALHNDWKRLQGEAAKDADRAFQ